MRLAFRRVKAYSKLVLLGAVVLVIGLVCFQNRNHRVTFWFFGTYENVNVLWLLGCTAAGSIVAYGVLRAFFSLWRDMRELARQSALEAEREHQRQMAAKLAEQEKRIDEKRANAIREPS